MRTRCAVLLAWLAVVLAGFALVPTIAGASSPASGSQYPWVQPWTISGAVAPDVGHWTQPPASVTITTPTGPVATTEAMSTSYPWVQPWELEGGAVPDVGHWTQPPAPIPAG